MMANENVQVLTYDEALTEAAKFNVKIGENIACSGGPKAVYVIGQNKVRLFFVSEVERRKQELDSSKCDCFVGENFDSEMSL